MKFLVLAFCVCAASAASFPSYKPYQAKAFASVSVPQTIEPVVVTKVAPVPVVPVVPVVQAARAVVNTNAAVKSNAAVKNYASDNDAQAVLLRSDSEVNPDSFSYAYESSNGIAASSTGVLKKVDNVDALVVEGQFQYLSPEGVPVQVSYVANENGFQPASDILPKGPPVPIAIARALEYIAAHPQKQEVKNF